MKQPVLMGMELDNPVVVAPGPWTRGIARMKELLSRNPGAVITESIVSESYPDPRPRYAVNKKDGGVQNIRIYSGLDLENWLSDLRIINENNRYGSNSKLIASIMGTTASELAYIAKKIEKTGVDGIELGLACPMGEGGATVAGIPELVYEYTKAVVDTVDIPVGVKLSANAGNLSAVVGACENAGASGISGIDTMRCILAIDIDTGKPTLPTYGGYSGAPLKPVGLGMVAAIVQSTGLPVLGIGGITNYRDMLEYIMAGASSCGIGTQIMLKGYAIIDSIREDLLRWMEEKGISDFSEIHGIALEELRSFEEIDYNEKTATLTGICACHDSSMNECTLCVSSCLEKAVSMIDGKITIDRARCDGCGLCIALCPDKKICLEW